ncbi:CAAX protease self-immunity [Nannocystis exedens]|uniref:CAAX protease self-immunity n=1 Tax=Nannocystis exedens TaxID=54 RepID=A0A1I2BEY3_9BACT|nr:CPBP family intramembrane glutamic endopeptidase [Nannocystis exedens]PCC68020.1 CAAX amino terminal protease self-immunity [Nannocystis exedens]SFE54517.1 CAAX protease self-immunity [Nannocystis exedens]
MRTVANSVCPAAWRVALVWGLLSSLAAVAVVPYVLTMLPKPLPLPVAALAAVFVVQVGLQAFLLAWAGTAAGRRLGVGSPWLEARLRGEHPPLPRSLGRMALYGLGAGVLAAGIDLAFVSSMPPPLGGELPRPSPWHGFLASFYGGIAEEVLTRLGLATVLAWATARLFGRRAALAVGIVGSALLFGALHLPAAAQVWPLTALVVARTLLLNAILGVLFGAVYVRRGLEHAIVMHFAADIALHVVLPLLLT